MKLTLSISRKAGTASYGSNGAGASVELDIDPETTPQAAGQYSLVWLAELRNIVDRELAAQQAEHRPAAACPEAEPDSGYVPRRQREEARQNGNGQGGGNGYGPPQSGSQLLAWARREQRERDLFHFGEAHGFDGFVKGWTGDQIEEAYSALTGGWSNRAAAQHNGRVFNGRSNGNGRTAAY
jgi:hypothetical protein